MKLMPKYRCPLCKKPLTKKEFQRALKIHEAQKEHIEARERQLEKEKRHFEAEKKKIKSDARESERQRTRRILKGKDRTILNLKETVRALKRGKTQQEFGPEFEVKLVKRLKDEFEHLGDNIQHKGQGGDVLHIVREAGKTAGSIIYECKWTPRISGRHVRQAASAKMSRHAEFAVLVTSGTKPGFGGFTEMSGVLVVAPAGVIALAGLLRNHLIGMLRAGVEKKRRAIIANQLLKFIKSAEFKNPIEEIVRGAQNLKEGLNEEFRWHMNDWKKRFNIYLRIGWDGVAIQENLRRVFHGESPRQMTQPKEKLALPTTT